MKESKLRVLQFEAEARVRTYKECMKRCGEDLKNASSVGVEMVIKLDYLKYEAKLETAKEFLTLINN
jgi:hypothetical protein